jgi:hypothetical protein
MALRTSASSGLTSSNRSVSVLDGAICSSGTNSPVVGSRYSVMLWWDSSSSSSQRMSYCQDLWIKIVKRLMTALRT